MAATSGDGIYPAYDPRKVVVIHTNRSTNNVLKFGTSAVDFELMGTGTTSTVPYFERIWHVVVIQNDGTEPVTVKPIYDIFHHIQIAFNDHPVINVFPDEIAAALEGHMKFCEEIIMPGQHKLYMIPIHEILPFLAKLPVFSVITTLRLRAYYVSADKFAITSDPKLLMLQTDIRCNGDPHGEIHRNVDIHLEHGNTQIRLDKGVLSAWVIKPVGTMYG
jgi:hypothetical protein